MICVALGASLLPGIAQAQAPPTATTAPARDVTHQAATLVATVQPGDSTLDVTFVYGRGGNLDQISQTRQVAPGSGQTEVAVAVTGLAAQSIYEVQVVAEDDAYAVIGDVQTFRTGWPPRAPSAETFDAAKFSATTATLTGTVMPAGQATTYHFEYGPTPALGTSTAPVTLPATGPPWHIVNAAITGLPPAGTVHFRLVATSIGGTAASVLRSFTTPPLPQLVSLELAAPSTVYGGALALGGRVSGIGDLTGRMVTIEGRFGPAWQPVAKSTIGAGGAWTARLDSVRAPIPLRAHIGEGADRATSPVRTPKLRTAARLTVKRARRTGPLMTVTVKPMLKGMVISIQRQGRNGRWTRVARTVARKDGAQGTFRLRVPRRTGRHRAVIAPKTAGWVSTTAR